MIGLKNMSNRLALNKNIYELSYIMKTISAFSSICRVSVQENDSDFVCSFFCESEYLEQIHKEFENYLIGLSGKYGF